MVHFVSHRMGERVKGKIGRTGYFLRTRRGIPAAPPGRPRIFLPALRATGRPRAATLFLYRHSESSKTGISFWYTFFASTMKAFLLILLGNTTFLPSRSMESVMFIKWY